MKSIQIALPHIELAGISNQQYDKPPLLAVHGWLDNAGSFERMLPFWQNFNVLAIDLPGHGLSAKRGADAHYHFLDWAYDLYQLVEQLGWQQFNYVGHSMGAMIGTVFCAAFPEKVHKLFMIDSIGLITTDVNETATQLRKAVKSRAQIAKKSKKGTYPSFDVAVDARVQAGGVSLDEAQILAKRGVKAVEDGFMWRSDPRLRAVSAMRLAPEQANDFITNIECPVMMVRGEDSGDMVTAMHGRFSPLFKNLRSEQMPGGHHCHMTYPQQAATMAAAFLKG